MPKRDGNMRMSDKPEGLLEIAPDAHFENPSAIEVRGARVHNLKDIDVDVPLYHLVAIAGVSGSGKSSLALGVLYAEGSRRYLEALSTYTRRRISQTTRASVDEVLHVPAAIALRQRPGIPGVHSTFGTSTELLNFLRLIFSRLGSHECPNGHRVPPSLNVAAELPLTCPECGVEFYGPSAEDLAFNSAGACTTCGGTGIVREVDEDTLIVDENLTLDEGAVAPWRSLMWSLMTQVAAEMGVRTDVPYKDLSDQEKEIVLHGPMVKKHILYTPKNKSHAAELDFTYYSAVNSVKNALAKVKDDKGLARVARFLKEEPCPDCGGSRLSKRARSSLVDGLNLAQATELTLDELAAWVTQIPATLPEEMRPMADAIIAEMTEPIQRLQQLGLGYLSLDRASSTLSNGERQRVQLARAVRSRTTGVLYVLDEPSIGLHPSNVEGLLGVMSDLLADGNSVVVVDHDIQVLREADWLIEIGPGSGANGGRVIAQGPVEAVCANDRSRIGPYLSGERSVQVRTGVRGNESLTAREGRAAEGGSGSEEFASMGDEGQAGATGEEMFREGHLTLETGAIHTVKPLAVDLPLGRLIAVTGVSGSGKTTLVLESLIPALKAQFAGEKLPTHVHAVDPGSIERVHLIDATPIGANVRSTVGTYSGILDDLRKVFATLPAAKAAGLKAGAFSYNTGSLRCPTCDGTGQISLDVQFLPDVDIACPACLGSRYQQEAYRILLPYAGSYAREEHEGIALPEMLALTIDQLVELCGELAEGAAISEGAPGGASGEEVRSFASGSGAGVAQRAAATYEEADALALSASAKKSMARIQTKLKTLSDLGLGYLTLGEATPALSGGEAQRLKLAGEMHKRQDGALFVFDEPTIGLHPDDVAQLLFVLQQLIDKGATVIVIEHDIDMIKNADYVLDLGPGGGEAGGTIVACGTPEQVAANPQSVTGRYLA